MSKIVIIGNSAAGFSCLQSFLNNAKDNEITVISEEGFPAYRRDLLIDYLEGTVSGKEIFLCDKEYYSVNKVNFLDSVKASRIDTKKQTVVLKNNDKINYDFLVIACGRKIKIPDIPGKTKEGVFGFYGLEDVDSIKERLALHHEVCIAGEPNICLRLCQAIAKKGKDIKIISRPRPGDFAQAENLEWIDGFELTEIIGEGQELKAFKLNNGKAVAASLVIFAGIYIPASEFFKDSGIKTSQDFVVVNEAMRTNLENVFACGSICRNEANFDKEKSWGQAAGEGSLAAGAIISLLERGKTTCQQTS